MTRTSSDRYDVALSITRATSYHLVSPCIVLTVFMPLSTALIAGGQGVYNLRRFLSPYLDNPADDPRNEDPSLPLPDVTAYVPYLYNNSYAPAIAQLASAGLAASGYYPAAKAVGAVPWLMSGLRTSMRQNPASYGRYYRTRVYIPPPPRRFYNNRRRFNLRRFKRRYGTSTWRSRRIARRIIDLHPQYFY